MIIDYDKNPMLDTDEKLKSLVASIMLALNELQDRIYALEKKIEEMEERN
jgi:hypothetical protein